VSIEVKTAGMIIVVFVVMMAAFYTQLETEQLAILGVGLAAGLAIVMFILDVSVYRPINGLIRRSRRRLGSRYEQEDPHDRDEIRELEFLINTIITTFTEVQTSTQATTNRSESDLLRLQAYNRQLVDVNDIGREISRALPYRETVERILARAKTFLKADLVALISLRHGSPTYEIEGAIGVQPPDMSADCCLLTSDCPVRRGMTEGNLVRSANHTCTLFPETMKSQLIIPLHVENVGSLALLATATNSESFDEIPGQILANLQDHMHSALANARRYDHMRRQVITDHLTRLYNRRYFMEQAEEVLRKSLRDKQPMSVVMIDIDRFKHFNDDYGHETGDKVLQIVADVMKQHVRASDICARYGGEEFAMLLPGALGEPAAFMANRLRKTLAETRYTGLGLAGDVAITISMGVATCPRDATEINQLLDLADQALYKAKGAGRNQVMLYGVEMQPMFYD
jgi:diguanylate cyclase (GGDEF)-like protein